MEVYERKISQLKKQQQTEREQRVMQETLSTQEDVEKNPSEELGKYKLMVSNLEQQLLKSKEQIASLVNEVLMMERTSPEF